MKPECARVSPLLQVRDLWVHATPDTSVLTGIDLDLHHGETLAVIGESGAGKSTLARAMAGFVPAGGASGSVRVDGVEVLGAEQGTLHRMRGHRIGLGIQGSPLNPVLRVGDQLAEVIASVRRGERRDRIAHLLSEVGLDPVLSRRYPHQLSGGQRHRVGLALALALDPELLVLDEPTAGLDAITASAMCETIAELVRRRGVGLVLVTHALDNAVRLCDRVMVLYAGQPMEQGPTAAVLADPRHPYARDLVAAYPVMSTTRDLRPIRGLPADARSRPPGCPFHPRCAQATRICATKKLSVETIADRSLACHRGGLVTVLRAEGVSYRYGRSGPGLNPTTVQVDSGEALGIVGPSGSGKTTLARLLSGDLRPGRGRVELLDPPGRNPRVRRRLVQLVRQDPWDAMSPLMTIEQILREPLELDEEPADFDRIPEMLAAVGLGPELLSARPKEVSGGQLQRVNLARALLARPRVLVADEPTSMLDASEQARLMLILRERQVELGLALILVSHDLALIRKVTDRVAVVDSGVVVEQGPTAELCAHPRHPTTARLLAAAPSLAPNGVSPGSPGPEIFDQKGPCQ